MAENIVEVTDTTFEAEVLQSDELVMVDFWAPWCQPCMILTPTVEAVADEYSDKVKVTKLNTDGNSRFAAKYRVGALPTVMFFKDGEMVGQPLMGMITKERITKALDENLEKLANG